MSKEKHNSVGTQKDEAPQKQKRRAAIINKRKLTTKVVYNLATKKDPVDLAPFLPKRQPASNATSGPTATELALIAATLRHGEGHNWSALASNSHDLWEACNKEVCERREPRRSVFTELCANLPKAEKYPVTLAEFLEVTLGKRRADDREKVYRDFLKDGRGLDLPAAGDLLKEHKNQPIEELEFKRRAFLLRAWTEANYTLQKRVAGMKGARKRSSEEIAVEEKRISQLCGQAIVSAELAWNAAREATLRTMVL
jgi:hypothetical protein